MNDDRYIYTNFMKMIKTFNPTNNIVSLNEKKRTEYDAIETKNSNGNEQIQLVLERIRNET